MSLVWVRCGWESFWRNSFEVFESLPFLKGHFKNNGNPQKVIGRESEPATLLSRSPLNLKLSLAALRCFNSAVGRHLIFCSLLPKLNIDSIIVSTLSIIPALICDMQFKNSLGVILLKYKESSECESRGEVLVCGTTLKCCCAWSLSFPKNQIKSENTVS